jgi:hypothetical protein
LPFFARAAFLATAVTFVIACAPDNRQADVKACVASSQRGSSRDAGQSDEEFHDQIGELVADCMKQAGYRHDMSSERCIDDVDYNAACYVRRRS